MAPCPNACSSLPLKPPIRSMRGRPIASTKKAGPSVACEKDIDRRCANLLPVARFPMSPLARCDRMIEANASPQFPNVARAGMNAWVRDRIF
jgi:hypothetical protein